MALLKSQEVDSFVARPDPARFVILVCGADAGLVSERVESLIRASVEDARDPFAVTRLSGDELASDPAKLVDEAQAIPMFGGRRAIWVRAGGRSFVAAVEAVLGIAAQDCRVVIEAGDLKRSAPLRALCERAKNAAVIVCYADTGRDIDRLIDEEMRAAGLSVTREARAALAPLLGGDRRASRNELRKLALYAHGRERVDVEDVFSVIGDSSALALDELVDAAFSGRVRDVETHFAKAVAGGATPGTVVAAASRQCSQLHKMRLAIDGGTAPGEVTGNVFFKRKAAIETALKSWTAPRLAEAIVTLGETAFRVRLQAPLAEAHARAGLMRLAMSARHR